MRANIEEMWGWLTSTPDGYLELHTREPQLSYANGRWSANYGGESLMIDPGLIEGLIIDDGEVVKVRILIEEVRRTN